MLLKLSIFLMILMVTGCSYSGSSENESGNDTIEKEIKPEDDTLDYQAIKLIK